MQYSFNNSLQQPREVLPGGYVSWRDPVKNNWQQLRWEDEVPKVVDLGAINFAGRSVRSVLRRIAGRHYGHLSGLHQNVPSMRSALSSRVRINQSAEMRAEALRWQIDDLSNTKVDQGP
jgi:hypothetical protein